MNDPDKCEHNDFDDYFERCSDCGMELEDMPEAVQQAYHAQFEQETNGNDYHAEYWDELQKELA